MTNRDDDDRETLGGRLEALGRVRQLDRGETLFNQGDEANTVFWVARGRLRLERHLTSGRVVTLSVVRAPAALAEAALFSQRYHCRAIAETASSVVAAPKRLVLERLEKDSSFARGLVRTLAGEVRLLRQQLELRNVRPASERLLSYLALRQDRGEPQADRPLAALATELGLTPEALYRLLARLEKEGAITRRGRRIAVVRSHET